MPKDPFKMTKEQFDAEMEKITSGDKSGAAYAKGINPKPYDVTAKRRKLAIKKNTDSVLKAVKPEADYYDAIEKDHKPSKGRRMYNLGNPRAPKPT